MAEEPVNRAGSIRHISIVLLAVFASPALCTKTGEEQ
jgi:hypothetical protein